MTNILKQAVEQSIGNGFDLKTLVPDHVKIFSWHVTDDRLFLTHHQRGKIRNVKDYSLSDLIFNHPFMRALCGEEYVNDELFEHPELGRSMPLHENTIRKLALIESAKERLEYVKNNILEVE